jgi:outer membrane lipoprotein-sorting protein
MKYLKTFLLYAIVTISHVSAQAQTADEIINQYISALGDKEKRSQVNTVYMEGDAEMMGNHVPSTVYIINGKAYKIEFDFNGNKVITCYTDTSGWTINPMMGVTTPTALPEDITQLSQILFDATGALYDYAAKGNTVELLGKEDLNGSIAYKLKVTSKINKEYTYFIDSATRYISKMEYDIPQGGKVEIAYSNYKKTDYGLIAPYTEVLSFPGLTVTTNYNKIEINKEIDQSIFEMPGK